MPASIRPPITVTTPAGVHRSPETSAELIQAAQALCARAYAEPEPGSREVHFRAAGIYATLARAAATAEAGAR